MSTSGLIMMLTTTTLVTAITVYFVWRVLKAPQEQDSDESTRDE